jgi:hypothetical protein
MLVLNCNLDDRVDIEIKQPIDEERTSFCYQHHEPKHVMHIAGGEALIECHDD